MKLKIVPIVFASIFLLLNTASASLTFSPDNGVAFSASDNIHNLPQLYSSLVGVYGQSYTDQNIMTQVSPGVWWISTGLMIPESETKFYINGSTCSELLIGKNIKGASLFGYPVIDHTKLICWVSGAPASFSQSGTITLYNPIHDTIMNNFQLVTLTGLSYCSVYNLSMDSTKYYLTFPKADYITVDNITITNGDPVYGSGLKNFDVNNCVFSNISTKNTGDYTNPATGSYGLSFSGSNNIVKDCIFNGSSWSTFNIFTGSAENPSNNTIINVTVINSGHNGFEVEGNDSTFKNISVYNSNAHNFFQVGKQNWQKMSVNNTYENIYSYNPGTTGMKISEGSDNISVINYTANLTTVNSIGLSIDDCSNATLINCTVNGNKKGLCGVQLTRWSGTFYYDKDHTIIDPNFYNCTYTDIYDYYSTNLHIINSQESIISSNGDYTSYYYPNITVKNSQGQPVQDAVITVNTSALNGLGKYQKSFFTDSNGKLYDNGNRSNWLAIPDVIGNESSTIYCSTNITAAKNGQTDSTTVDPSNSWYSPNPASFKGPEIVLTLDTDSSVLGTFSS
jgi:hypothetical protein